MGLFGYVDGGTIENLGVTNANVMAQGSIMYIGVLAGVILNSATITSCYTSGALSAGYYRAGGLVGELKIGSGTNIVTKCYSSVNVDGAGTLIRGGGLVGQVSNGNVSECYCTGFVTNVNDQCGGFAGFSGSGIINCYCTGNVSRVSGSASTYIRRVLRFGRRTFLLL